MDNITLEKIKHAVSRFEKKLIEEKYTELGSESGGGRLSSNDIETTIKNYPGLVSFAPITAYYNLSPVELKDTDPKKYSVDFGLWFDGKSSDLTATLLLTDTGKDFDVSLVNLSVL